MPHPGRIRRRVRRNCLGVGGSSETPTLTLTYSLAHHSIMDAMPPAAKELTSQLDSQRSDIFVERFDLTVRELVRMAVTDAEDGDKELNIRPAYQRAIRWEQKDESKLMESLYLGIPVPPLFVAANDNGTWDIVDGLQRVSSLIHFTSKDEESLDVVKKEEPLKLKGLEKLTKFNGSTLFDIPKKFRLRFEKKRLRVVVLQNTSDYDVRYDLFERLNKQGVNLSNHEIRACVHVELMEEIREISEYNHYRNIIKMSKDKKKDGTVQELVLRFIAYKNNREDYSGSVKNFLDEFSKKHDKKINIEHEKKTFEKATKELDSILDGVVSRESGNITPISLLEGILVAAGELVESDNLPFSPNEGWMDDEELLKHTDRGTNARKKLFGRIERSKDLLKGAEVK